MAACVCVWACVLLFVFCFPSAVHGPAQHCQSPQSSLEASFSCVRALPLDAGRRLSSSACHGALCVCYSLWLAVCATRVMVSWRLLVVI